LRARHSGGVPGAALAARAKMAAAPCNDDAPDRALAAGTRPPRFLVNPQPLKKVSLPSFNVNVIAEAGSLKIDSLLENFLDRPVKAARGGGRNVFRLGERMDASLEERLVRIDVSQTRYALLVQQPAFDGAPAPAHGAQKFLFRRLLRVRAQAIEQRLELFARRAAQASETADIAKTQLFLPAFKQHPDVRMKLKRSVGRLKGHLARHPKAEDKINWLRRRHAGQFERQHFALPLNGNGGPSLNLRNKIFRTADDDPGVQDLNRDDSPSQRAFAETAQNRFNLWKFRHGCQS